MVIRKHPGGSQIRHKVTSRLILDSVSLFNGFYCPFHVLVQTNFRRYYFYFLPDQAQTHLDHWKVLDELWGEISTGFDNRWRISPYTPIVKIGRFRQRYNVAEISQFLQWGSMGKFFTRSRISMKFGTRARLKRWNNRSEFQLDRARSKDKSPKIRLH